ncbi:hypothetical protein N1030_17555 [Desulfovibrio mangrovi]|uniref:hypothetical protein n=1 Tax=Desulfovibrio mangrovi TaxID=2976983 RepID=UPI0022467CD5|nr:hypothetical protein [Desulfovibrio mangrovi]UZP67379.1 hypothetical protein N1030_17555 [Desulfovibrio mangrovi]
MYKNQLTVYGEHLAKAQTLPANTTAAGNGGSRKAGSMLGAAEVVMVAATPVAIAENATLTLSLQESADDAVFADVPVLFRKAAVGKAMSFAAGEVMARLPMPSDTAKYVKASMGTDDAAASGTVNIIFEYLPR